MDVESLEQITLSKLSRAPGAFLFGVVWVGGWTAGTLFFDYTFIGGMIAQIVATNYPATTGTITESQVQSHSTGDGTNYSAAIKYEYQVDGESYSSDQVRYNYTNAGRSYAESHSGRFAKDAQVTVYYNPAAPSDAVLITGIESIDLFVCIFMLPFNLIMLASWYVSLGLLFGFSGDDDSLELDVRQTAFEQRITLERISSLALGGVVAGAIAFVSVFVIGFGFGFSAPMPVVIANWAIIVGAALFLGLRQRIRQLKGWFDLVIDDSSRTLTLPAFKKRKRPLTMGFEQVDYVEVVEHDKKSSDERVWRPTVYYSSDSGESLGEPIGDIKVEEKANRIRDWIRETIDL